MVGASRNMLRCSRGRKIRAMSTTSTRPPPASASHVTTASSLGRRTTSAAVSPVGRRSASSISFPRNFFPSWNFGFGTGGRLSTQAASRGINDPGLFMIPGLYQPRDFVRLAHEAVAKCDDLRESLASFAADDKSGQSVSRTKAVEVLYTLDSISQNVCNVVDAAELCRQAHVSVAWRESSQEAFSVLQKYLHTLNADTSLYRSVKRITSSLNFHDEEGFLTAEERRFAQLMQHEFELEGIHLNDQDRVKAQECQTHLGNLETQFVRNIADHRCSATFDVQAESIETLIPRDVLKENGAIYSPLKNQGDQQMIELAANSPIAHTLLSYSPASDVRRQAFVPIAKVCHENVAVLENLRRVRHEAATLLGFESHADRFLRDKMAKSPKNVSDFLQQLQRTLGPQFAKEMGMLQKAKTYMEGPDSGRIEAWDVKYYTNALKSNQYEIDPLELAPYLGLSNCISAMQMLVRELFGISMKEVQLRPEERWDIDSGLGEKLGQQGGMSKYAFIHEETQQDMGIMYLDLHPRPGKYTHAAHFTVRCGCVVDGPPDSEGSSYQTPIVALVCNMNSGAATLCTHAEVETLFHEFGHALHSLLSRASFQHLSGTRAAMDFIETPSHWMENFTWDTTFLRHLAKHSDTGEPLSEAQIANLRRGRNLFRCIELQNQIVLAEFDQIVFGAPPTEGQTPAMEIWASIHKRYGVPYAEGTHGFSTVGHLVSYGSGYYSYLYAQVFAHDIWHEMFDNGKSLERKSGEMIWKRLLRYGGTKDAKEMLTDLLGRSPRVGSFLKSLKEQ